MLTSLYELLFHTNDGRIIGASIGALLYISMLGICFILGRRY